MFPMEILWKENMINLKIKINNKTVVMKKFILSFAVSMLMLTAFGQSEKYVKAMQEKVTEMDSVWDGDKFKDLSAAFERIADAEKTQWLPYYYAALAQVNMGFTLSMDGKPAAADKIDPVADK